MAKTFTELSADIAAECGQSPDPDLHAKFALPGDGQLRTYAEWRFLLDGQVSPDTVSRYDTIRRHVYDVYRRGRA